MSGYELYVFFLCLIVFTALTALFTIFVVWLVKLMVRLIRHGAEDEKIKSEYYKSQCGCGGNCVSDIFDKVFSAIFGVLFILFFAFSLYVNLSEGKVAGNIAVPKVVQSASMSKKYEGNKYLFKNNLNDQIQTFDIILTHALPDEMDLELYDIVVYEVDGELVVHRIVQIEEPNEKHPNERYFRLQGDAVEYPDNFPVRYEQMKSIYTGDRIPYIGSFVMFMQSPAGYLCILLIVFGSISIPLVEKILEKEREKRLIAIGEMPAEGELFSEWQEAATPAKEAGEASPVLGLPESKAISGLSAAYAENLSSPSLTERYEEEPLSMERMETQELAEEQAYAFVSPNVVAQPSAFESAPASLDELLAKGYSIKNIRVKLLKKQQAFAGNKSKLLRLAKKGDIIHIYLGFNVKEKVENYTLVNIPSERMQRVAPAQLRITLKREKRGGKA